MRAASWKTASRWPPSVVPGFPPTGATGLGSLNPASGASAFTMTTVALPWATAAPSSSAGGEGSDDRLHCPFSWVARGKERLGRGRAVDAGEGALPVSVHAADEHVVVPRRRVVTRRIRSPEGERHHAALGRRAIRGRAHRGGDRRSGSGSQPPGAAVQPVRHAQGHAPPMRRSGRRRPSCPFIAPPQTSKRQTRTLDSPKVASAVIRNISSSRLV